MTGQELKELRRSHGVTQADVAKFLGYTVNGKTNRSQIAKFEGGYATINPRIAMVLKMYFESLEK